MNEQNPSTSSNSDADEIDLQAGAEARRSFVVTGSSDELRHHLAALYAASNDSEDKWEYLEEPVPLPYLNLQYDLKGQGVGGPPHQIAYRKRTRSLITIDEKSISKKAKLDAVELTDLIRISQEIRDANRRETLETEGSRPCSV